MGACRNQHGWDVIVCRDRQHLWARTWSDGTVIRLAPDLQRSDDKQDFFAPSDWEALDARAMQMGGSNPIPLEGSGGGPPLILALGKDQQL